MNFADAMYSSKKVPKHVSMEVLDRMHDQIDNDDDDVDKAPLKSPSDQRAAKKKRLRTKKRTKTRESKKKKIENTKNAFIFFLSSLS